MNMIVTTLLLYFVLAAVNTKNVKPRVFGGQQAEENEFPFQGALIIDGEFRCGVTLITLSHLLTAASCVVDFVNTRPIKWTVEVRLGSVNWTEGSTHLVSRISYYKDYSNEPPNLHLHDIAVIHILSKVRKSKSVSPIGLPKIYQYVQSDITVTISGFGSASDNKQKSTLLMKMVARMSMLADCGHWFPEHRLQSTQICTMPGPGLGCTTGDIGSPITKFFQSEVVGIVSVPMSQPGIGGPDISTSVIYYVNYIASEIKYFTSHRNTNILHPGVNFPWTTMEFLK